jgi:hypothetical protein
MTPRIAGQVVRVDQEDRQVYVHLGDIMVVVENGSAAGTVAVRVFRYVPEREDPDTLASTEAPVRAEPLERALRADIIAEGWDLDRIDREMRGVCDTLRVQLDALDDEGVALLVRELRTLRKARMEVAATGQATQHPSLKVPTTTAT